MKPFWILMRESVFVQALVTLLLVGGVVVMSLRGQEVPPQLTTATGLALGFYFGSKSQKGIEAYIARREQ